MSPSWRFDREVEMRSSLVKSACVLLFVASIVGAPVGQTPVVTSGIGPAPRHLGPLAFGPDAILFAADAEEVFIYALDLSRYVGDGVQGTQDVPAFDEKVAALLGTEASNLTVTDLTVHSQTGNTFVSVMRGQGDGAVPVLLRVDGAGQLQVVDLGQLPYTRVGLPNPPGDTTPLVLQGGRSFPVPNYPSNQNTEGPMSTFGVQTITDMAHVDGRLYVAGLSSEEFASTLRSIAYPFEAVDAGTSVEIWHAPHNQFETRSPIYTFVPYELDNEPHLIASYLCTPLVKFPVSSLQPGADVRGVTIAEFGNANRPLDMIVYQKGGRDYLLMSNSSRGVMKIPTNGFASAAPITEAVPDGDIAGEPFESVPELTGVEQLDLLDDDHALVLVRSEQGPLNLHAVVLP
jgi:hypothetical protein